jgi:hypothetical protein
VVPLAVHQGVVHPLILHLQGVVHPPLILHLREVVHPEVLIQEEVAAAVMEEAIAAEVDAGVNIKLLSENYIYINKTDNEINPDKLGVKFTQSFKK